MFYNKDNTRIKDVSSGKVYQLKTDQEGNQYIQKGNKIFSKVVFKEKNKNSLSGDYNAIANKNSYANNLGVLKRFCDSWLVYFIEGEKIDVASFEIKLALNELNEIIHRNLKKEKLDIFNF